MAIGLQRPIASLQVNGNVAVGSGSSAGVPGTSQLTTGGASPIANRLTFGTDGTRRLSGPPASATNSVQLVYRTQAATSKRRPAPTCSILPEVLFLSCLEKFSYRPVAGGTTIA